MVVYALASTDSDVEGDIPVAEIMATLAFHEALRLVRLQLYIYTILLWCHHHSVAALVVRQLPVV